jgi:hypothetical protein
MLGRELKAESVALISDRGTVGDLEEHLSREREDTMD